MHENTTFFVDKLKYQTCYLPAAPRHRPAKSRYPFANTTSLPSWGLDILPLVLSMEKQFEDLIKLPPKIIIWDP
jgi:hypothetical protein